MKVTWKKKFNSSSWETKNKLRMKKKPSYDEKKIRPKTDLDYW